MRRRINVKSWTHRFICECGAKIEVTIGDMQPCRSMPPNRVRCPGCGVMDALPPFPHKALNPAILAVRILGEHTNFAMAT